MQEDGFLDGFGDRQLVGEATTLVRGQGEVAEVVQPHFADGNAARLAGEGL